MKKVQKLEKGQHILTLPLEEEMSFESLFPKEISGSTIEKYQLDGEWSDEETILYENNSFTLSDDFKRVKPFETIRLNLKRSVTVDWEVTFKSNSGVQKSSVTFVPGFDFYEALYLMQLSNLVYEEREKIEKILEKEYDVDSFYYYSKQSHEKLHRGFGKLLMLFFRSKKSIVDLQFMHLSKVDKKSGKNLIFIIFRGSQEPEDWMTNFNFQDDKFKDKGRVHKGFKEAIELFFKTIEKRDLTAKHLPLTFLEDFKEINSNSTIILAGHSLGGALATLAGCYLHELGIKKENLEIYSFGAPPVGTKEFCNYYEDKLNIFRVTNENDVVPKLDKITPFYHMGEQIVLPSNDGEIHACSGYIDNLIDVINFEGEISQDFLSL